MVIETKYNIGDYVKYPYRGPWDIVKAVGCPFCLGRKKIVVDGEEYECKSCNSEGVLETWGNQIFRRKGRIVSINIFVRDNNIDIRYYVKDNEMSCTRDYDSKDIEICDKDWEPDTLPIGTIKTYDFGEEW